MLLRVLVLDMREHILLLVVKRNGFVSSVEEPLAGRVPRAVNARFLSGCRL